MAIWRNKTFLIISVVVLVIGVAVLIFQDDIKRRFFQANDDQTKQGTNQAADKDIATLAQDLTVPWGLAELPDGDILVTERSGTLRRIGDNQQTYQIEGVRHVGEGGLLGVTLHPDFAQNNYLYIYLTTETNEGLINRVERYTLNNDQLTGKKTIISNIPGAGNHDGGRIAFGPDGNLYITTGDAGREQAAQDTSSLAGKILRITETGGTPANNPFDNPVYSYGHRNPQGLAWDEQGRLWSTEHGRSGANSGFDELNLIEIGGNYGWPTIEGDETRPGMIGPVAHSGPETTWAPGSLAHREGSLFFGGLRGESLYEAKIINPRDQNLRTRVDITAHLRGQYGRIRTVEVIGDRLVITTSNTDGRGEPAGNDDRVISVDPTIF